MAFQVVDGLRPLEIGSPGAMRQRLNGLILDGHKRATAGLLLEYVKEDEELETEGELLALFGDAFHRLAPVVVTEIATVPFIEVPWKFAQAEGEGDETLEEWREGHRRFWRAAGEEIGDRPL